MGAGTFLRDALHAISQGLTYPVIVCLIALMGYGVFCIGSIIVELIVERRHFKVAMPDFIRQLKTADAQNVADVIKGSGMLVRQKKAMLTLYRNGDLPEEARWALAKKLLTEEEAHYRHITARNDTAARIAPMVGLMGTLIPLGPGIVAMSQGQTDILAQSLLIAFDTTVAGLVTAAVCMVVSKIRKAWYAEYASSLEAAVTTILEKIDLVLRATQGVPPAVAAQPVGAYAAGATAVPGYAPAPAAAAAQAGKAV